MIKLDIIPEKWEEKVQLYCTYLTHNVGLQSSTIKSYVSAIKHTLVLDGYDWNDRLLLLSTFVKSCKLHNDHVLVRFPIQIGLLELLLLQLEELYQTQGYLEALYKALFVTCYYGLLRVGEVTETEAGHTIKAKDIHVSYNKKSVLLVLRSSKTHTVGDRPQKIVIKPDTNCRLQHFCPVNIISNYLELKNQYNSDEENLFSFRDGTPVRATLFREVLRRTIANLHLNSEFYDTHSFRIGRATDLMKNGVPVDQIKHQGRWKSNAVFQYLR